MQHPRPLLVTTEESSKLPILIVDKKGLIGKSLAAKLREHALVVLVTNGEIEKHQNVIHIPYHKLICLSSTMVNQNM
jgi:hypothetical protein